MGEEVINKANELTSAISRLLSLDSCRELLDLAQLIQAQLVIDSTEPKSDRVLKTKLLNNIQNIVSLIGNLEKKSSMPKINLATLKFHYQLLAKELREASGSGQRDKQRLIRRNNELSQRQEAILTIFNSLGQKTLQLKDLMKQFPHFTGRTIRFDLNNLMRLGYLVQTGFGRGSFYALVKS